MNLLVPLRFGVPVVPSQATQPVGGVVFDHNPMIPRAAVFAATDACTVSNL